METPGRRQENNADADTRNGAPYAKNDKYQTMIPEKFRNGGIKSMNLAGTQLVITAELSGVFCQGVQYYDLKNIQFINNSGLANLIDLLKSLLRQGVEVQFVNVNEKIKKRIRELGLDHILKCS